VCQLLWYISCYGVSIVMVCQLLWCVSCYGMSVMVCRLLWCVSCYGVSVVMVCQFYVQVKLTGVLRSDNVMIDDNDDDGDCT
jgi:hypothetical protein